MPHEESEYPPSSGDEIVVVTASGDVVEVRLAGAAREPMAFTETGSSYLLGDLADGFALDDAEAWVQQRMR